MRALIIDEPWIGLILSGRKTWEMRAKWTNIREPIGLIRKGSRAVVGVATVADCLAPVNSSSEYADRFFFHQIPEDLQRGCMERGWLIPWVLKDVTAIKPVQYAPKSGQQDWVTLSDIEKYSLNRLFTYPVEICM